MTFSRVDRLDISSIPSEVTYEGPCRGGQVGAAYVRWPDGHRSVLTRGPDRSALVERARSAGIPAPRYELVRPPYVIQELLPGTMPEPVGEVTVRSMLEINRRSRGLLPSGPSLELFLRDDGPGFCLHGPLRARSARTRRLLAEIEQVGAAVPETMAGDDLVHTDFHPGNVLVSESGQVTGVVDWDGCGRGDAGFDLVTLRFDLERRAPDLVRLLPGTMPEAYWAHMSLRMVDWAIRHFTPDEIDRWIGIAERLRP